MSDDPRFPLEQQLITILAANRENAHGTQLDRARDLRGLADDLRQRYGLQKWANLKQKHVMHLVERLKAADTGTRDIDGKLTNLRWLLRKIGKPNLLPRSNRELGIEPGERHKHAGKVVSDEKLQQVLAALKDQPRLAAMVLLGRTLGLRFREAALFEVAKCWRGRQIVIFRGAKGGRDRYVNITNPKQVETLKAVQAVAPNGSLIPQDWPTFEKFRQWAYRQLRRAELGKKQGNTFHDMRRSYACDRMRALEPVRGRTAAALLVARELGHNRTEVLEWYMAA